MPEYNNKIALSGIILLIALSVFSFSSFHLPQIFKYEVLFYQKLPIPKAIITYLLIAVSNIVYFNVLGKGQQFKIDQLDIIFLAYLSCIFISTFNTTESSIAIAAFFYHINLFLSFVLIKAIFLRHHELSKRILFWVLTLGSLLLVVSYIIHNSHLLSGLLGEEFVSTYQGLIKQTRSLVGPKNQTGSFAILSLFLIWYVKPNYQYNYYTSLVTIVLIGLLLLIGSRNAWVAGVLMGLVTFFYINPSKKRMFQFGAIMVVLVGLFLSTINLKLLTRHLQYNTFTSRMKTWINSFEMFQMNPILGNGVGQFPILKNDFNLTYIIHPHNDILTVMVETGIVGVSIFLLLIGSIIYIAFQCLSKFKVDSKEQKIYLLLIIILGYLSMQMLDQFKYKMNHQIILLFVIGYIAKHGFDNNLLKQYDLPKVKVIASTVLSLSLLFYATMVFINFNKLEAINSIEEKAVEARIEAFQGINKNIIGLYKDKPIDNKIAHLYAKQKKWDKYLFHLKEAEKRYPYHPTNIYNLERWHFRKKEYKTALAYYLLEVQFNCNSKTARSKYREYDKLDLSPAQRESLYSIDCPFLKHFIKRK